MFRIVKGLNLGRSDKNEILEKPSRTTLTLLRLWRGFRPHKQTLPPHIFCILCVLRYPGVSGFFCHSCQENSVHFFNTLNQIHPALQLTLEAEDGGHLPHLDVNINQQKKEFLGSIYRKPTFSGLPCIFPALL